MKGLKAWAAAPHREVGLALLFEGAEFRRRCLLKLTARVLGLGCEGMGSCKGIVVSVAWAS